MHQRSEEEGEEESSPWEDEVTTPPTALNLPPPHPSQITPLISALMDNNLSELQRLIDGGADVNEKAKTNQTVRSAQLKPSCCQLHQPRGTHDVSTRATCPPP